MPSKKSRIQLYADECFPIPSTAFLKSLGYTIIHAYDKKLISKNDQTHLKEARKLKRVLITVDRDFLYYNEVNLDHHPGVIVISVASVTPKNINDVCKKLLPQINEKSVKNSVVIATKDKLVIKKNGKKVSEKNL